MKYNLEERTLKFSKDVLRFTKKLKIGPRNSNIISQLLKSATSIGANYREANAGSSKRDFKSKISICRKEAQETEYWLDLLEETENSSTEIKKLQKESHELKLIFGKIFSTLKNS
ncbi:MAG: four helix bundle protein [bacterium]|nr:four helix bundle protein [bacterium]